MSNEVWFEEDLVPPSRLAADAAKGLVSMNAETLAEELGIDVGRVKAAENRAQAMESEIRRSVRGVLRMHIPRWRPLSADEAGQIPSGLGDIGVGSLAPGKLYLVRLGMELDVPPERRTPRWGYSAAWCRAYLFAPESAIQPRVVWVYPQRLYEGEPRTVKIETGLGIDASPVRLDLLKIGTDLQVGQVTPVTLGFHGDEERSPYWELRAKDSPLLGLYHFWMIVEQPAGCGAVRIACLGEGDLRTRVLTIPVGPKERTWENRPSVVLAD